MTQTQKPVTAAGDVPAVTRASAILDLVATSADPVSMAEIAQRLGLARSSAHGLCHTLVNLGLLERRARGFALGGHVMAWANAFIDRSDIVGAFTRLWDQTPALRQATVTLTILDGTDVVYIASRQSDDPFGITFRMGMRLPAAYTATGKAILSTLDDASVLRLHAGGLPPPLTDRSTASIEDLLAELAETRARGFSIDNEQVRRGMFCFGAPIHDFSGRTAIGGFAVSVRADSLTPARVEALGGDVIRYARQFSRSLGS
jgi:DNA-binding IclR family transcriptional regulator